MSKKVDKLVLARRAYQKKWRENNPEKVAEHVRRFYAKQIAALEQAAKGGEGNG